MIAIDRGPEPPELTRKRQRRLARLALDWQTDGLDGADREAVAVFVGARSSWLDGGYSAARSALLAAQRRKCAYCERKVSPSDPIDHHRPRRPKRADSTVVHPGYFWLTWSHDNLLIACSTCNGAKGNRFPLDGERAAPWAGVADELPRWIDPGREDPREHIGFRLDPTLGKWVAVGLTSRGRAMIYDLSMTRHDPDWQDHVSTVERFVHPIIGADGRGQPIAELWSDIVPTLLGETQPFRALTHAWLAAKFDARWRAAHGVTLPALPDPVPRTPAPMWTPRPDLDGLPQTLRLWVRALGDNPISDDLDAALCAFAATRRWPVAELAGWMPRSEGTVRIRLAKLRGEGRVTFDGQYVGPAAAQG